MYKIPCHNCHQVYIGETGRTLGVRIKEHRTESDSKSDPIKTRTRSTTDTESELKSDVAEHARDHNHVIDWDSVKILERETERSTRLVREACQVRMLNDGVSMNKDDGGYDLLHIWDPLLRSTVSTTKRSVQATPVRDVPTSRAPDPRLRGEGGGAGGTPLQQLVGIRPCHQSLMLQVVNTNYQHLLMMAKNKRNK